MHKKLPKLSRHITQVTQRMDNFGMTTSHVWAIFWW